MYVLEGEGPLVDLIIKNGFIIDGTGNPGYYGHVLVENESIAIIRGILPEIESSRTVDASDHVVCPGFIDLHSHAGLTILGEPHHEPKIRQGVTTELIGIDGISHAPFKTKKDLDRFIRVDSCLNWYPPNSTDWLTVAELLSKYDNKVAVNIAYIVGNSPIRIWSVGWNQRPATDSELSDMKAVLLSLIHI